MLSHCSTPYWHLNLVKLECLWPWFVAVPHKNRPCKQTGFTSFYDYHSKWKRTEYQNWHVSHHVMFTLVRMNSLYVIGFQWNSGCDLCEWIELHIHILPMNLCTWLLMYYFPSFIVFIVFFSISLIFLYNTQRGKKSIFSLLNTCITSFVLLYISFFLSISSLLLWHVNLILYVR